MGTSFMTEEKQAARSTKKKTGHTLRQKEASQGFQGNRHIIHRRRNEYCSPRLRLHRFEIPARLDQRLIRTERLSPS